MTAENGTRRFAVALACALAIPSFAFAQGRTLKPIQRQQAAAPATAAPLPPEACVAAVHQIAEAWADARLEEVLHPDFPNRAELLDAIRRAALRATNVALVIESVPSTRYTPPESRGGRQVTDCIADVVTRVMWDDPQTGKRRRGDEGRAQWQIEFELAPTRGASR